MLIVVSVVVSLGAAALLAWALRGWEEPKERRLPEQALFDEEFWQVVSFAYQERHRPGGSRQEPTE